MGGFIERLPIWLRWFLTPIASAATFIVVIFVANIASKIIVFISGPRGVWSENFFDYLVNPGLAGYLAVGVVGLLAPKAKRMTSVVIAAIWILLAGGMTFFSILSGEWKNLLFIVAVVVGAGSASINMEKSSV